jgi:glycosyltransferase involved in cell wall biosynthesis
MRILFATAHKHLPELRGGMEVNTHELATAMLQQGLKVGVLCGLAGLGWTGLVARLKIKLLGNACPRDDRLGYPTWRCWDVVTNLDKAVNAFRPDVIVVQGGAEFTPLLTACLRTGATVICYLHTQDKLPLSAELLAHPKLSFITNSEFTKSLHDDKTVGVVVRPLIRAIDYATTTDRSAAVFVNPAAHKGLNIVVALARSRPDIPFIFVVNQLAAGDTLRRQMRDDGIYNIEVLGPIANMQDVYKRARLVLAPSQCLETWGRIATEAHFSGIPVLASDRGGLLEAVGPAGVCVSAEAPHSEWLHQFTRMWDDQDYYSELSEAAFHYSKRDEIQERHVVDSFVEFAQKNVQRHSHNSLTEKA